MWKPSFGRVAESFAVMVNQVGAWAKENPASISSILTIVAVVGNAIIGFTGLAYVVLD